MIKVNFRIVVTSKVKEREGRKEKRAVFFFLSVKFFIRKKKTKENMANISIFKIWIEVYRCLLYFPRFFCIFKFFHN